MRLSESPVATPRKTKKSKLSESPSPTGTPRKTKTKTKANAKAVTKSPSPRLTPETLGTRGTLGTPGTLGTTGTTQSPRPSKAKKTKQGQDRPSKAGAGAGKDRPSGAAAAGKKFVMKDAPIDMVAGPGALKKQQDDCNAVGAGVAGARLSGSARCLRKASALRECALPAQKRVKKARCKNKDKCK